MPKKRRQATQQTGAAQLRRLAKAQQLAVRGAKVRPWDEVSASVESDLSRLNALVAQEPGRDQASRDRCDALLKYSIVRMVAGFESFYRSVYKHLIDNRADVRDRLYRLDQHYARFGLLEAAAMWEKKISLGQIVSQLLPTHGLPAVEGVMTSLLDDDYPSILRDTPTGGKVGTDPLLYGNYRVEPYARGQLGHLFLLRNEIAHHVGNDIVVQRGAFADLYSGWRVHLNVAATVARTLG